MRDVVRRADWQAHLVDYLQGSSKRPFQPGRHDCALFCAGAVEAMTGADLAAGLRGKYRSQAAGLRQLRALGYDDHVSFVAAHFEEVPVSLARPGDIAVVPLPRARARPALAIVQGEFVYVPMRRGMGTLPLLSATRAFRVN